MLKRLTWILVLTLVLRASIAFGQLPPGFGLEVVVGNANVPVALVSVPDGRLFYAELLTGSVRVVRDGRLIPEPFITLPIATAFNERGDPRGLGILGLAAHPDFSTNGLMYVLYTPSPEEVVVAHFKDRDGIGVEETDILRQPGNGGMHNGGRLRFSSDGTLLITRGDNGMQQLAQDSDALQGKIMRVNPDGSIPDDNPDPESPIFASGIRNSFGIAVHPVTGAAFFSDNGPTTDDEINLLVPAGNYGWPRCVGACNLSDPLLKDPLISFTPTICPVGMDFYTGNTFPEQYRGDLFFASCKTLTGGVHRIKLVPPLFDRVGIQEDFFEGGLGGVLDVKTSADGSLYFSTFDTIFRIVPPDPDVTAGLRGTVTDLDFEGNTTPIVGAVAVLRKKNERTTLFKLKTLTDEAGVYVFTGVPDGEYRVVVKKDGLEKARVTVDLMVGETTTSNIRMSISP